MVQHGCLRGLSYSRQKLLNTARGVFLDQRDRSATQRILRCFPLTEMNVCTPALQTPHDFHTKLCQLITSAKRRVYLASLYIGPGANPLSSPQEKALLKALQSTAATQVKILLDKNRALRAVPIKKDDANENKEKDNATISSAEACFRAIEGKILNRHPHSITTKNDIDSGVYLLSVLPAWQQLLLSNPYNEVAGVFHLKCYIIDDDIILSGANLSEEYFCDRIDRYLWLTAPPINTLDGSKADFTNNLVEFYIKLVDTLCQYAEPYELAGTNTIHHYPARTSKNELLRSLENLLTVDASAAVEHTIDDSTGSALDDTSSSQIIAYSVPTFQSPHGFLRSLHKKVPSDADIIANLITATSGSMTDETHSFQIRLASAYLNLTDQMIEKMGRCRTVCIHLLTAGYNSHGFKPNSKKLGNKGKSWIPAVFDALGRQCVNTLQQTQLDSNGIGSDRSTVLWYYQREGWTFHAKGMWFTEEAISQNNEYNTVDLRLNNCPIIVNSTSLCVATHGSGNFGERSANCDMESNLILIFADAVDVKPNTLQARFQADWNSMCKHTTSAANEKVLPLSFLLRILLPLIRPFF
jgi:CDP-diacylglycerol---glycerol-3-phosphate 3-phosphatidyltransferase